MTGGSPLKNHNPAPTIITGGAKSTGAVLSPTPRVIDRGLEHFQFH
jgi:hypothetical protein